MANQRFKVSVIVSPQRMGEAVAALAALNFQTTITPVIDAAAPVRTNGVPVVRVAAKQVRNHGNVRESGPGKAILSVFTRGRDVAEWEILNKAVTEVGYASGSCSAYINRLIQEGALVRAARGTYRLPSTTETLRQQAARDASFSG